MPCPTMHIDIVSRGKGQSCMAKCAYNAGKKMWSQYEYCWKEPHSSARRVKLIEVMLPPNAPKEYADPQTLWNAVDAAEKSSSAQTARTIILALPKELTYEQNLDLIHDYCQKQFVDKGMCVNLFYHDEGDGNPHVHLMLTMRAMDEHGQWLPKSTNVYQLNANGERMTRANGSFIRTKVDTVDWNDHKYGEIWRHEWEVAQNDALENAGRPERVDMRSLERQGITDRMPQVHLGPAAAAMERKGVSTERGEENRKRIGINKLLASLTKLGEKLSAWLEDLKKTIKNVETVTAPEEHTLVDAICAYNDLLEKQRSGWSYQARQCGLRKNIQRLSRIVIFIKEYDVGTVEELGVLLDETRSKISIARSAIRQKEQQIRDINAFFNALDTVMETKAVAEGLDKLYWKGKREKYQEEHAAEFEKRNKAIGLSKKLAKKLNVEIPLSKDDRKMLKENLTQLQSEIDEMRPQLEACKRDLDKMNELRYCVRKVIPDALPDPEQSDFVNQSETQRNQYELKKVVSATVDAVTNPMDEEMQEMLGEQLPADKTQEHNKTKKKDEQSR